MATDPNIMSVLNGFRHKKILIIGDVMVDEYLWGQVSRISPEAPVPVVSCLKREHRLGGAANVAVNIKAMEAEPVMCSFIGDDEAGEIFQHLLKESGMVSDGILISPSRKTTLKTRVIGNHQQLLRVDHEHTDPINQEEERDFMVKLQGLMQNNSFDAVIFQDYDKGVITEIIIEKVVSLAKNLGVPVLVDPKKRNFHAYHGIDLFKPNFKEFTEGLNLKLNKSDHQQLFEAAGVLHAKGIRNIMITLSEKGVFISNGTNYRVIPAEERGIADVSGAGDTVIAVASLGMASGLDIFHLAQIANLAGGLVCEKVGVVPVTKKLFEGAKSNAKT